MHSLHAAQASCLIPERPDRRDISGAPAALALSPAHTH